MKGMCYVIDRPCEKSEYCTAEGTSKIRCTHKCDLDQNNCLNGGSCIYDDREDKTKCE